MGRARASSLDVVCAAICCVVAGAACGDPEQHVVSLRRVRPAGDPTCGAAAGGVAVQVSALGDYVQSSVTSVTFDLAAGETDLVIMRPPQSTRVLRVEVTGSDGDVLAAGRTFPVDLSDLADGAELPVYLAPPRGLCPVGPLQSPRVFPLTAPLADGVLVLGGIDSAGLPVASAERYDAALGAMVPVTGSFYGDATLGLIGASITTLVDGRVAVVGGRREAYQLYDAKADRVESPMFLSEGRAHHAAVALPDGRLFLAGGCAALMPSGSCDPGSMLTSTTLLDVDTGGISAGPLLSTPRAGGVALATAAGEILVIGGADENGEPVVIAERVDPSSTTIGEIIMAASGRVAGHAASLAGGGALVGFAYGAEDPESWVIPPGSNSPSRVAVGLSVAPRKGVSLTPLEDGTILVAGGVAREHAEEASELIQFVPFAETFVPSPATTRAGGASIPRRRDHGAVRLDDGTVLLVGGRDTDGVALADAWLYRHDLVGRDTSEVDVVLVGEASVQAALLTPRDPARAQWVPAAGERDAHYRLGASGSSSEALSEWVLVAGPQFLEPKITLGAGALGGGVGVMLAVQEDHSYRYVEIMPGAPMQLQWLPFGAPEPQVLCTGGTVPGAAIAADDRTPTVEVEVAQARLTAAVDGVTYLDCGLDARLPRGHVGVGVIGSAGAAVRIDSIAVVR